MAKLNLLFTRSNGKFGSMTQGHIYLEAWASNGGPPLLSAQCVTHKELEDAANYLKRQLDNIVARSKLKFEAARKMEKKRYEARRAKTSE